MTSANGGLSLALTPTQASRLSLQAKLRLLPYHNLQLLVTSTHATRSLGGGMPPPSAATSMRSRVSSHSTSTHPPTKSTVSTQSSTRVHGFPTLVTQSARRHRWNRHSGASALRLKLMTACNELRDAALLPI